VIDRIPRIAAVQAAGAAPFAASYERGFAERITVHAQTVASAIRIGDPASYDRAVAVIRETNGVVLSVPDEELLDAKRLVDRAGIGCEPASAASVAGVKELRRRGTIGADERVVAVLTGHVLKDPEAILRGREGDSPEHSSGELPIRIEPTLTALTTALDYPA
jgi:threonine synthase